MVFNALLTISYALGILGGFYFFFKDWQPFYPFIINGNIFWLVIITAALNIVPSVRLGKSLKTGRLLFHHYFYGFLVLVTAVLFVYAFTSMSLWNIFLIEDSTVIVNGARFLILGSLTLLIDDFPDISRETQKSVRFFAAKTQNIQRITSLLRFITGVSSFYVLIAVSVSMFQNPQWVTLANFILLGTLAITSVSAIIFSKKTALKFSSKIHSSFSSKLSF